MTELSSESVLVMDWIDGIPLSRPEELDAAGTDRAALARAVTHSYAQMMFHSDRFHADPHPGNLIAQTDERLGLVDFGEVGLHETTRSATRSSACWARCSSATVPRSGRPSSRSVAAYGTSIGKDSARISTYCFDRSPTRRCRT